MALKPPAIDNEGSLCLEFAVRALLAVVFWETEYTSPFHRKIHAEELWLYKNPRTASYVPTTILWPMILFVPTFFIIVCTMIRRDKIDGLHATLSLTLALGVNGVVTNIVKLIVGRPRPDFFWRCFPDGNANPDMNCTGSYDDILDGYKSFPSGHSSFSFASMGFTSLYLAGKLHCFNVRGRGQSWRLCFSFLPLFLALLVALSRTADYHHHWQDVLVGSLLGLTISYLCYYQYYPSLDSLHSDRSYGTLTPHLLPTYQKESEKYNDFVSIKWI